MAGSLIKNAGGGLAPTGGYIVGREDLVEDAAYQLTAPGLGDHMGSYAPGYRLFFQGLFMAPHVVLQALKGAVYTAAVGELLGYDVFPKVNADRYDLIQAINLKNGEEMEHFCVGMQAYSPVDAHVHPIPGDMPGYEDKIIMAGGTFVQGSSIELSADGPVRPPYTIFMQGGLVFEHSMLGILGAAEEILKHR
jgi:aluminum resistance protein